MDSGAFYEAERDKDVGSPVSLIGATEHYPLHFHKKFEITYMCEGKNTAVIANRKYVAEKDDILFVSQYQPHAYSTSKDAKRLLLVPPPALTQDVLPFFETRSFSPLLSSKAFNREKILPLLSDMLQAAKTLEKSETRDLLFKGLTNTVFAKLLEEYADCFVENKAYTQLIHQILLYIDEHYAEKLSLDYLAKHFCYNRFYLSKIFNGCIGESLTAYINNVRVEKALALLRLETPPTITQAAFSVGFNSLPSFYRAFERAYHCAPKEYVISHNP